MNQEETSRRLYTTPHPFYCGIDLHARLMYVCLLDQSGEVLVHRHMKTDPETFLKAIAPYRQGMVVAVACMFTWYWLADLCADEGIPFVLGHALSMKAIHGGKAKHDPIDSPKMAALLRGGRLPQASVSPATRRATRDWLRRRRPLAHQRAALLAHVQHTHSPYNLPAIGTKIADKAHREGVAERCADAAVHKSIAVDLALITSDDARLRDGERTLVTTAKHHDANTRSRCGTPCPVSARGSAACCSTTSLRSTASPGSRMLSPLAAWCNVPGHPPAHVYGTSGAKIGQAHLTWAFAAAAVLCLRDHPAAQTYLARLEKKHEKGQALTILAQKLARAVYDRLKRPGAFERETFFPR